MRLSKKLQDKKLVVFDMDGTLTPSKAPMKRDMAAVLRKLLEKKIVAVIGGGKWGLFREQLVRGAHFSKELMGNLFLFPGSSTSFYRYKNGRWNKVYSHPLTASQKKKIFSAFREVFKEVKYKHPARVWGVVIEDRGTQVTFSALGQKTPIPEKEKWKKKNNKLRLRMTRLLQKKLPDLEVRAGGLTSIDVTKKGIDKSYGIRQIEKVLKVKIKDMLFVGDAIFPGGNDYAAVQTGVDCIKVSGPEETRMVIRFLLDSAV